MSTAGGKVLAVMVMRGPYFIIISYSFILINLFILKLLPVSIDYGWVQDRFPFLRSLNRMEFSVTLKHCIDFVSAENLCPWLPASSYYGETGDSLGVRSPRNALSIPTGLKEA